MKLYDIFFEIKKSLINKNDWRTFPKRYIKGVEVRGGKCHRKLDIEHLSYESKGQTIWIEWKKQYGIILEDCIYRKRRKIYYEKDDPLYTPPQGTNAGNYCYFKTEEYLGHFVLVGKTVIFMIGEEESERLFG